MKKYFYLFTIILITLSLFIGCTSTSENNKNEEEKTAEISLYFMKITENEFVMEKENREVEKPITAEKIGVELLKGPESEDLKRVIPEDTKILGVDIKEQIAYVNFSSDILHGNYGSSLESMVLSTIIWTFTELPDVNSVQILIDGEIVETLGGHIVITEPLTR
jgi:spore germination protein GerM